VTKSVVLLSGGLDSSVNLWVSQQKSQVALALTFDYGQRAASQEVSVSAALAQKLQVPHRVVSLDFFRGLGNSALTRSELAIPQGAKVDIDDLSVSQDTAKSVWIPNRNGVFLNIAAAFAESLGADWVVPGFNWEEAQTFPDNSEEFLQASTKALSYSTANQVRVKCFTADLNKIEIVALGEQLNVPWSEIWPCYLSGEKWCGECESCQRSRRAFLANQVPLAGLFAR
jgi:7-cyano-7-deazaguanine synthase